MQKYMPEGNLISTKLNRERISSVSALQNAYINSTVLEARAVIFDQDKNLIVELGTVRGIIPYFESAIGVADGSIKDISIISRVGKPVNFIITDFGADKNNQPTAILSRAEVQRDCNREFINLLKPGDIIDGRITRIEKFGCFVDIGCGITSLLPIDYISVSRISHPKERFFVGQDIKCVVRQTDESGRIILSHRELLGSWEENAAMFNSGETVVGIVRSVENYGVFVELAPNLAGLADPYPDAVLSQKASVFIKSINPQKMKIKLIIIDCFDSPEARSPIRYFIESGHIDKFKYSPEACGKAVETLF